MLTTQLLSQSRFHGASFFRMCCTISPPPIGRKKEDWSLLAQVSGYAYLRWLVMQIMSAVFLFWNECFHTKPHMHWRWRILFVEGIGAYQLPWYGSQVCFQGLGVENVFRISIRGFDFSSYELPTIVYFYHTGPLGSITLYCPLFGGFKVIHKTKQNRFPPFNSRGEWRFLNAGNFHWIWMTYIGQWVMVYLFPSFGSLYAMLATEHMSVQECRCHPKMYRSRAPFFSLLVC